MLRPSEVTPNLDLTRNVTNMLIKWHWKICGQKAIEDVILLEGTEKKEKKITYWSKEDSLLAHVTAFSPFV